jgi:hypothetical protein
VERTKDVEIHYEYIDKSTYKIKCLRTENNTGRLRRTRLKSNKKQMKWNKERKKERCMKSECLKTKHDCAHKRNQSLHKKYRRKGIAKKCNIFRSEHILLKMLLAKRWILFCLHFTKVIS